MPLTYAYRKHPVTGFVQHVTIPLEDLPRIMADGWYDSPSKVPDTPGYAPPPPPTVGERDRPPVGEVYGEQRKRR